MQTMKKISEDDKPIINGEFSLGLDPEFKYKYVDWLRRLTAIETRAEAIKEVKDDPVKFISYVCKTESLDKDSGQKTQMLLELDEEQKEYIKALNYAIDCVPQKNFVLGKSRQRGATEVTIGFIHYRTCCFDKQDILMTSSDVKLLHTLGDRGSLMEKITYMFDHMNPFVRSVLYSKKDIEKFYKTKKKYHFEIKTSLVIGAESMSDPGRGKNFKFAINDEFAKNPFQKQLRTSLSACCNSLVYISTLRRPGDIFSELWFGNDDTHVRRRLFWENDPLIRNKEEYMMRVISKSSQAEFDVEFNMKFEDSGMLRVFPTSLVQKALALPVYGAPAGKIIGGWDVAFEGSDDNCLYIRQGNFILYKKKWKGLDVYKSVDLILELYYKKEFPLHYLVYDDLGAGISVTNEIRRRVSSGFQFPFEINGVTAAWKIGHEVNKGRGTKKKIMDETLNEDANLVYLNKRAMLHFKLRKILENMTLPEQYRKHDMLLFGIDQDLVKEMDVIRVVDDKAAKIQIIPKRDIRKPVSEGGLGRSPDSLDALLLTYSIDDILRRSKLFKLLYGNRRPNVDH